uniref:SWIM-type domain-containing protein n=2 Tax=Clytia hemisphaerica TaxID=252671 RepID=A0A7M5WYX6_9CNID
MLYQKIISDSITDLQSQTPPLILCERKLLTLSSHVGCTDGILYAMPLIAEINGERHLYIRCFESGVYKGYFDQTEMFGELMDQYEITKKFVIRIYTEWDVLAVYHTERNKHKKGTKHSTTFKRLTTLDKHSIDKTIKSAHDSLKETFKSFAPGFVFYCRRDMSHTNRNTDPKDNQFYLIEGLGASELWFRNFQDYGTEHPNDPYPTVLEQFKGKEELSLIEQFQVLSHVPNLHSWASESKSGTKKKQQYFASNGYSPRDIILRALDDIHSDMEEKVSSITPIYSLILSKQYHVPKVSIHKQNKRRTCNQTHRRKVLDKTALLEHLDHPNFVQPVYEKLDVYPNFRYNIFNHGTIVWRELSQNQHVVVMNDYDSDNINGNVKFNHYATVTLKSENYVTSVTCSCGVQKALETAANDSQWDGIKCCHIRLLKEIVRELDVDEERVFRHKRPETQVGTKIDDGLKAASSEVLPLPASAMDMEKFSVRSDEGHQFVHLFRSNTKQKVFVICKSGICSNNKEVKLRTLDQAKLCPHLKVFKNYIDQNWQKHALLKQYGSKDDGETTVEVNESDDDNNANNDDDDVNSNPPNLADVVLNDDDSVVNGFDRTTQTWKFYSKFPREVSKDMEHPDLKKNGRKNLEYAAMSFREDFYLSFEPTPTSDVCNCQLPWKKDDDGNLIVLPDGKTTFYTHTFYTHNCAIDCDVFKLVCPEEKCVIHWDGSNENIFRLSQQVAVAEQLLWDFVNRVITTKCNFAAFCQNIDQIYTYSGSPKRFISPKTFLKVFFAWASNQGREFRRCCPWCGSAPKVLACDGTKVGILCQNLHIDPIETIRDPENELPTQSRRFDRCFIAYPKKAGGETVERYAEKLKKYRESRDFLKNVTSSNPEKLSEIQIVDSQKKLFECLPTDAKSLFTIYFESPNVLSPSQIESTRKIFHLLAFDAPLSTFLPIKLLLSIESLLSVDPVTPEIFSDVFLKCAKFNRLLGSFLKSFRLGNKLHIEANKLLQYLCKRVRETHAGYPDVPEAGNFGDYNPAERGQFYYFSETGQQIRENRNFSINGKSRSGCHDDQPTTSSCNKTYPNKSKKGASFLFLWFCPSHGHCYGGHIVDGPEGRKDPASSLFTYLEKPPDALFYDFACSFEEYTLNREALFFIQTCFYHDLFHGFTHNCSSLYSAKGLFGMNFNTSICEQFNSYLQCLKASAKHMSQKHFVFYIQFFIDLWNYRKEHNFRTKLACALAGSI